MLHISRAGARAACGEGDLGGIQLGLLLAKTPVLGVVTNVKGLPDVLLVGRPPNLFIHRHLLRFSRSLVHRRILINFDGGLLGSQQGIVSLLGADLGVLLLGIDADVHLLLGAIRHVDHGGFIGGRSSVGVVVVVPGIVLSGGSIVGVDGEPGVVDAELQGGNHLAHGVDDGPNLRSLFHCLGKQPSGVFLVLNPAVSLDL